MNFIMNVPGFKGVDISKVEEVGERTAFYVSLPKCAHKCPVCGEMTTKVHDYRVQKVNHLKWLERLTVVFYKRRRYACGCGKHLFLCITHNKIVVKGDVNTFSCNTDTNFVFKY